MAVGCKYIAMDINLKEQFINDLNDNGMIVEIIQEFSSISDTSSVTNEQVLTQARTIAAQRAQMPC